MSITSSWFRSGTVSVTNQQIVVQGFSTAWVNHITPIGVGDAFTTDFSIFYEIVEVLSDTQVKLDRAYAGSNGSKVPYAIVRNGSSNFAVRTAAAVQKSLNWYQEQLGIGERMLTEDGDLVFDLPDGTQLTLWSEKKKQKLWEAKLKQVTDKISETSGILDRLLNEFNANVSLPTVYAPLANSLMLISGKGVPATIDISGTKHPVPNSQNVAFSRASTAWLDGVEYGVDEPRYTSDGKLLVESQATNFFKGDSLFSIYTSSIIAAEVIKGLTFTSIKQSSTLLTGLGGTVNKSFNVSKLGKLYVTFIYEKNTLINDFYGYNRTAAPYFKVVGGLPVVGETRDGCTVVSFKENQPCSGFVTVYYTSTNNQSSVGMTIAANFPEPLETHSTKFCVAQIEENSFSSHIPTTTTSITRAADIATINGQNPVVRWENNQEPVDIKKVGDDFRLPPAKYRDLKGFNV